jgi:hypothetical protein
MCAERIAAIEALLALCACAGLAREVREYMGRLAVGVNSLDALVDEGVDAFRERGTVSGACRYCHPP